MHDPKLILLLARGETAKITWKLKMSVAVCFEMSATLLIFSLDLGKCVSLFVVSLFVCLFVRYCSDKILS